MDVYLARERRFSAGMVSWNRSWIDARTLHKELKVGKVFANWIKGKIAKYEFIENEDYKFLPKRAKTSKQGGRPTDDYSLTLDMAKELSMVENNKI